MKTYNDIPHGVLAEDVVYKDVLEHRDLYGAMPTPWIPIEDNFLPLLPSQRIQDPTSSECVAQTAATVGEMATGTILSATPIFQKRMGGKGSYGMYLSDAANIYQNTGTTTEELCPSLSITDATMDNATVPSYLPFKSIIKPVYINPVASDALDQMKEVLDKKIGLFMTFNSNGQEWQIALSYIKGSTPTFGHCITGCLPRLIGGTKTIICRDTCGQNTSPKGYRILDDTFLKSGRCTGIMYLSEITDTTVINPETNQPLPDYPQDAPKPPIKNDPILVKLWHSLLAKYFNKK